MSNIGILFFGVMIIALDILALVKLSASNRYTRNQRVLQMLVMLALPLFGAMIVLFMLKPDRIETGDGFPAAPRANRDAISGSTTSGRLP